VWSSTRSVCPCVREGGRGGTLWRSTRDAARAKQGRYRLCGHGRGVREGWRVRERCGKRESVKVFGRPFAPLTTFFSPSRAASPSRLSPPCPLSGGPAAPGLHTSSVSPAPPQHAWLGLFDAPGSVDPPTPNPQVFLCFKMTEITEENFLDIMLGPGAGEDSDDGAGGGDDGGRDYGRGARGGDDGDEIGAGEADEAGDDSAFAPAPPAAPPSRPPAPPAGAGPRDDSARRTVDMIERDILEAEAALARRLRVRGAFPNNPTPPPPPARPPLTPVSPFLPPPLPKQMAMRWKRTTAPSLRPRPPPLPGPPPPRPPRRGRPPLRWPRPPRPRPLRSRPRPPPAEAPPCPTHGGARSSPSLRASGPPPAASTATVSSESHGPGRPSPPPPPLRPPLPLRPPRPSRAAQPACMPLSRASPPQP
jgi:hypothetical protein